MNANITINHGSAMADGSCNSCGRNTQTHGDYDVREIRLRSCSIRVCEDCARILESLLRGELPEATGSQFVAIPQIPGSKSTVDRDEQLNRVAKMMAAAYWRGRIHGVSEVGVTEAMIEAAANAERPSWLGAAHYAITGNMIPQ